jgi:hypothetical protein
VVSEPPPHGACVRRLSTKERAIAAGVTSYVLCYGCSRPMAPLTSPFTRLRLRDARRAPLLPPKLQQPVKVCGVRLPIPPKDRDRSEPPDLSP